MTEDLEAVVARLDALIALLRLVHADRLQTVRADLAKDPVNQAILDRVAEEWIPAGDLTKTVMAASGQGNSTVRARIAGLVSAEVLKKRGAGAKTEYRSSGLI